MSQPSHQSAMLKLIGSMIIFGTIGIVRRFIPFPSSVIALARGVIGTLFLVCVHIIRREKMNWTAIYGNLKLLLFSGALIGINWIFLFEAYRYTSVAVATICYYMAPVIVIVASPFVLKEKLTKRKGICAGIAFAGMILVSGVLESGFYGIRGILCGLCAASMYATVVMLNKCIHGLSPNERTLFQLGFAALAVLPYVLVTEDPAGLTFAPKTIILLVVAGVLHTGFAYTLYFGSLGILPAQTAALLSYIDPVVAVILSVGLLHENMSAAAIVGAILVLGAMVSSERK